MRHGTGARWAPYAALGAMVAAAGYVALVDPGEPGHYPICPFYAVTGYYCPGCGSLRMVHALARGHVAEAFGDNALTFAALPFLAYLWVRWAVAAGRGGPPQVRHVRPGALIVFAMVGVVFWIVRNLHAGQALAP